MVELSTLELINGSFAIVIFLFFLYIGLSIIIKYFKIKEKRVLFTGIAIIFMSFPWLAMSSSFLSALITKNPLSFEIYFIIGYGISFGMLFWLLTFTTLVYQNQRKVIISLYLVYIVFSTILFYIFLIDQPNLIGDLSSAIFVELGSYLKLRTLVKLIILILTGVLIYLETKDVPDEDVKIKGRFILIGVILFVLGGILFTFTNITIFPLIFFIPSLFGIYGGFLLPDWMKKLFIQKKKP